MKPGDRIIVTSDTSPQGGHSFDEEIVYKRTDGMHVYGVTETGCTVGIPLLYVTRIVVIS